MFDELVSYRNLTEAARSASAGRREREYVIDFHHRLPEYLVTLRRELLDGSYTPGPYREFYVYEHKRRKISAAPFRDRVVHHALCNQIYPLLDRRLGPTIFANRIGMGAQRAAVLAQRYMRRHGYFMKLDIRNYFPSIDHSILQNQLQRVIPCRRTWELACLVVDCSNPQDSEPFLFPGDNLFTPSRRRRGLPIGNLTSQHFANFYLHPLDHFLQQRCGIRAFIRYVDDILLFDRSAERLHETRERVTEFLRSLRLVIHGSKAHPTPTSRPLPFLGYVITRDRIRVRGDNLVRARKRHRRRVRELRVGERTVGEFKSSVFGWLGYAGLGGYTAAVGEAVGVRRVSWDRY